MAPGRRSRSSSRGRTTALTDPATAAAEQQDPDAAAALAAEEDARAEEQLRARLPYEVLNIGRRIDIHQAESTTVLSSLQGEVSKLTSLQDEVSKLTEMIANLTTQKSHPFSTPGGWVKPAGVGR